jgi:hypothetical protein
LGETQTIAGKRVGAKPCGFQGGSEKKGEKGGLKQTWGDAPRSGALGVGDGEPSPQAKDDEPRTDKEEEGSKQ